MENKNSKIEREVRFQTSKAAWTFMRCMDQEEIQAGYPGPYIYTPKAGLQHYVKYVANDQDERLVQSIIKSNKLKVL